MSGMVVRLRLKEIAAKIPAASQQAVRDGIDAGVALLDETMPIDTGYMIGAKYGRIINQYAGELVSPAYYTVYQELGFYNVRARRFIPGKFFMRDALERAKEVAVDTISRLIGGL